MTDMKEKIKEMEKSLDEIGSLHCPICLFKKEKKMPKFFKFSNGEYININLITTFSFKIDKVVEGFRVMFFFDQGKYTLNASYRYETKKEAQAEIDRFLAFVEGGE